MGLLQRLKHRHGEPSRVYGAYRDGKFDELLWVLNGEIAEGECIEHEEHCCRRANAEGEDYDRHEGRERMLSQRSSGESDVVSKPLERGWHPDIPSLFSGE